MANGYISNNTRSFLKVNRKVSNGLRVIFHVCPCGCLVYELRVDGCQHFDQGVPYKYVWIYFIAHGFIIL